MNRSDQQKTESFICRHCSMEFSYISSLETHVRYRHPDQSQHKCDICDFSTVKNTILAMHMKIHTGEKTFKCDLCSFECVERSVLRAHMSSIHTDMKQFGCSLCAFSAKTSTLLAAHIRNHNERQQQSHKCDICPFKSAHISRVRSHIDSVHKNQDKQVEQLTKTQSNNSLSELKIKRTQFSCSLCNFRSKDETSFSLHKQFSHDEDEPFKCSHCDYSSKSSSTLKRHLASHAAGMMMTKKMTIQSNQATFKKQFSCLNFNCKFIAKNSTLLAIHLNKEHLLPYVRLEKLQKFVQCKGKKRNSRVH